MTEQQDQKKLARVSYTFLGRYKSKIFPEIYFLVYQDNEEKALVKVVNENSMIAIQLLRENFTDLLEAATFEEDNKGKLSEEETERISRINPSTWSPPIQQS